MRRRLFEWGAIVTFGLFLLTSAAWASSRFHLMPTLGMVYGPTRAFSRVYETWTIYIEVEEGAARLSNHSREHDASIGSTGDPFSPSIPLGPRVAEDENRSFAGYKSRRVRFKTGEVYRWTQLSLLAPSVGLGIVTVLCAFAHRRVNRPPISATTGPGQPEASMA